MFRHVVRKYTRDEISKSCVRYACRTQGTEIALSVARSCLRPIVIVVQNQSRVFFRPILDQIFHRKILIPEESSRITLNARIFLDEQKQVQNHPEKKKNTGIGPL